MKISVIIPAYNVGDKLYRAVESVFSTGYSELEIVIVEDGSTDSTLKTAQGIVAEESDRIRLLTHVGGRNLGAGASRNLGIRSATGDLIAFLDADDLYLPNRFDRSPPILEANPSVDAVYESYLVVNENEVREPDWKWRERGYDALLQIGTLREMSRSQDKHDVIKILESGFHTTSVTIRKSLFERVGYFNPSLRLAQDTELWIRCVLGGDLVRGDREAPKPVSVYLRHPGNRFVWTMSLDRHVAMEKLFTSALKWARQNGVPHRVLATMERWCASKVYEYSDYWVGVKQCLRSKYLLFFFALHWPLIMRKRTFWGNVLKLKPAQ